MLPYWIGAGVLLGIAMIWVIIVDHRDYLRYEAELKEAYQRINDKEKEVDYDSITHEN